MDFYVYDNIYTFNKRHPYQGIRNTRLNINQIEIPENHSFWFYTDMNLIVDNVNLQKRYVHIHNGIGTTNTTRFKKTPKNVKRGDIFYNPKEKRVEIKTSILPWKKPIYAKKCVYYGAEIPKKNITIIGEWFYDHSDKSIHLIIDYNSQKISFHWEDKPDDPSMAELLNREAELEMKIDQAEKELASK